ncbi:PTPA-CTERM sorting domain-containing protein [Phormidesmis priestleyi ULC007]|uniref:PTPA-CTERM sorting domain-containing protein n=1 Tax=Phormidesmis priestleyi ULC007 TaxID=1920490 RepID=A0A2T1DI73_9CYAN|nr:PTPA-CTERM sorting domain-containing protein [Phormidesmis priestleyi]PSB20131.1 PTPA-CTERM sorting domain-containing protein [Phormidesmis priestleyi ULC007]PZO49060.1 MAG: PTPA-CTERM sorting domain-containing protein [Phormidesmis priestleyi]
MFSLKQFSLSVSTIAATVTISAVFSTAAQAAIVGGQVTGTWQYDYDGAGGLSVGDAFTADYTYDSDSVTTTDYSNSYDYTRYLVDSVPLLSLVLNSGTVSHAFDLSNPSSFSNLQRYDVQYNPDYYSQYSYTQDNIQAYDSSALSQNSFYAYNYLGQDYSGNPFSASFAQFYSYDNSAGTYPAYAYTYGDVAFSGSSPATPVPTPALLPGLVSLGLGVLRKRKAQAVLEAQKA